MRLIGVAELGVGYLIMNTSRISVDTDSGSTVTGITAIINEHIHNNNSSSCIISIPHTTAAITVLTNEEHVANDVIAMLETLVPTGVTYQHASPKHVAAHFFSALIGTSVVIPLEGQRLRLGAYQRIVLIDFEGPSTRNVELTYYT